MVSGKPRPKYVWTVGNPDEKCLVGVCRHCFASMHNVGHSLVDTCCAEIQPKTEVRTFDRILSDFTGKYVTVIFVAVSNNHAKILSILAPVSLDDAQFYKDVKVLVESKGINLTPEQKALMVLPNTVKSLDAYTWMDWYFTAFGDKLPHKTDVHLDYVPMKEIWDEYMEEKGRDKDEGVCIPISNC
jgi:hypothetical protein